MAEISEKHLRRSVTDALKAGYLHFDAWAEIDDLILDGNVILASSVYQRSLADQPVYMDCLGGQERWRPSYDR